MRTPSLAAAMLIAGVVALGAQSAPAPPPPAELARRLQAHYDTVRDFTADFTHHYRGGMLRKTITERGRVRIKKPGRMEWTYTAPEKKLFVSDGSKMYSHLVDDKVVYVSDLPEGGDASTAMLFLTGRGNLVRDFNASAPNRRLDGSFQGAWQLDLTPRSDQTDFTSLSLVIDPRTLALRALSSVDAQGGVSSFVFTNLRENVGLSDNQFAFKMPRDVDVVR
jgi:outer membrane lipoprotein carrier protein